MSNMKKLVVLSIYDGGYNMNFLEDDKMTPLYTHEEWTKFEQRFGKPGQQITIEELAQHYTTDYIVVICEDGAIEYSTGTKDEE